MKRSSSAVLKGLGFWLIWYFVGSTLMLIILAKNGWGAFFVLLLFYFIGYCGYTLSQPVGKLLGGG